MTITQAPDSSTVESATYWEYLCLDDLLTLQRPLTPAADERPFIILHQVAELLFSLVLHELTQLTDDAEVSVRQWKVHLERVVLYFSMLLDQLAATRKGIDREQFRMFRDTLFPASGFQSVQFRRIEIVSARLYDLLAEDARGRLAPGAPVDDLLDHLYWRRIGTGHGDGRSPTLDAFESRYLAELRDLAVRYERRNLASRYLSLPPEAQADEALVALLRTYDRLANVTWPAAHRQLALSFLVDGDVSRPSTGGSDWVVYLDVKRRHVRYFEGILAEPCAHEARS